MHLNVNFNVGNCPMIHEQNKLDESGFVYEMCLVCLLEIMIGNIKKASNVSLEQVRETTPGFA